MDHFQNFSQTWVIPEQSRSPPTPRGSWRLLAKVSLTWPAGGILYLQQVIVMLIYICWKWGRLMVLFCFVAELDLFLDSSSDLPCVRYHLSSTSFSLILAPRPLENLGGHQSPPVRLKGHGLASIATLVLASPQREARYFPGVMMWVSFLDLLDGNWLIGLLTNQLTKAGGIIRHW